MGVLKAYHRMGIGRKLFEEANKEAKQRGYSFIQVKTVQMGRYDIYDDTNSFLEISVFRGRHFSACGSIYKGCRD